MILHPALILTLIVFWAQPGAGTDDRHLNPETDLTEYPHSSDILAELNSGKLLMVDSRRRNGLILIKRFHAEFAGPGAAVGGAVDVDSVEAIPVGDFCLLYPQSTLR